MKKFFALTLALVCVAGLSLGCKPADTTTTPAATDAPAAATEEATTEKAAPAEDAVEAEARRNEKFRALLRGVWLNSMPNDVWARVQVLTGEGQEKR